MYRVMYIRNNIKLRYDSYGLNFQAYLLFLYIYILNKDERNVTKNMWNR